MQEVQEDQIDVQVMFLHRKTQGQGQEVSYCQLDLTDLLQSPSKVQHVTL